MPRYAIKLSNNEVFITDPFEDEKALQNWLETGQASILPKQPGAEKIVLTPELVVQITEVTEAK